MSKRITAYVVAGIVTATIVGLYVHQARQLRPLNLATAMVMVATSKLTPFQRAVVRDLDRQVAANIRYQDGYFMGGDPPPQIGVCTDVVIRSYRAAGIDIQRLVAADVAQHPSVYGIRKPDPNIDHRRCRNLEVFFSRKAKRLPTSGPQADWQPGDIVLWGPTSTSTPSHIGVIADHLDADGNPTVVHHWPGLPVSEMDWLFRMPIVSHFRWPTGHG